MRRILWVLCLLCPGALQAQYVIDLTTLPADYWFTSRSNLGLTEVKYLRRDGDLFLLESRFPISKGKYLTDLIWTNRESQLVKRETQNGIREFFPHDCAPGQGECEYTIYWEDGDITQARRSSYMIGDVEISREIVIIDGEEYMWHQDCTTFDQWGFWIDYVRIDFEGNLRSGRREESSHEPQPHTDFEQLQKLCSNPPDLVS